MTKIHDAMPDRDISVKWLIAAIRQYQAGWTKIGTEAFQRGDDREYLEARGAYSALRQVRKLLLEDPDPADKEGRENEG